MIVGLRMTGNVFSFLERPSENVRLGMTRRGGRIKGDSYALLRMTERYTPRSRFAPLVGMTILFDFVQYNTIATQITLSYRA